MFGAKPVSPANPNLVHSSNGHTLREEILDQAKVLAALRGVRVGDFGVRLPLDWTGVSGTISEVFNEVVELNQRLNHEFERISRTVGREGKTEQRVALGSASGDWATTIESVNLLIADLTQSNASLSAQLTDVTQSHANVKAQLTELTQSHANVRAQLTDLTEMARDRDLVLTAVARSDLSR